ncbi:hypothetical protein IFM89_015330 [Coptis chinensis]|uniref:Uncharacterized protein n=1 Tax=Coptis chinensis TaxID=261450 RepID=A0A835M5Z9_9MAGN|nr:hypothetical protein IFM89_015330 [Coptis chinensis]
MSRFFVRLYALLSSNQVIVGSSPTGCADIDVLCVRRKERWLASPLIGTGAAFELTCYSHTWLLFHSAAIDANIILPLVQLLQHAEFDIKKEAAWALSNATSGGSREQIQYLANQGCIKPVCDLLVCPDPRIVTVCLEGLENILKVGETDKEMGESGGVNKFAQMVDDCGGLDKIENLQSHDNNEIYEKAVKLLEKYWLEDEEEEQNFQDGVDGTPQGFNFESDKPPPPGGFKFG